MTKTSAKNAPEATATPTARVRVGANSDFAPFCRFADGAPEGIVVDRVRAAVAAERFVLEWVPLALPDMMSALARGDVDVLCGIGASADRTGDMDMSDPIVITGGAGFALNDGKAIDLEAGPDAWAAAGLKVVSPVAGPLLGPLRAVPGLRADDGVDYPTSLAMVLAGETDIAALNFHVGSAMAERDHPGRFRLPRRPYLEVPLVAAVPKGRHADFLAALNRGLRHPPAA